MEGKARWFMLASVVYAIIGFVLGVVMGASGDFALRSVHSHLNLIGWVSMAIYAVYYNIVPAASRSAASTVHFWLANAGLLVLSISLALHASGVGSAAAGAGIGSVLSLLSFLVFGYVVVRGK